MPALTPSALRVLQARYLRRDEQGEIRETPEQLFERVAGAVAAAEPAPERARFGERFLRLLRSLEFLPNSPTLMNAGTSCGQLSACFVLPVTDSIEGIFESIKDMALVQSAGGGTGFSFSRLRPAGDLVLRTGGHAAGPLGFLRVFDAVSQEVAQGGKRRGANMAVLRCDHPDVLDFVRAKLEPDALTSVNLSVGVTDAFMRAVREGATQPLRHPRTGAVSGHIAARELFDAIAQAAWRGGDPGLLFLDAIERANPTPEQGRIEATNPCGEVPLLPYEACNLGSINLARMLLPSHGEGDAAAIDWNKLRETTRTALRFLDDVVEVNRLPVPQIAQQTARNRKLGLGLMGFAEALLRLGVSYDSDRAEALAEQIMQVVAEEALAASRALAEQRGPFPAFPRSIYAGQTPLRNATRTAIAPTGTIGILAGTSAGIEPLFALAYRRSHRLGGPPLREVSPLLLPALSRLGADAERVLEQVEQRGRLGEVEAAPDALKRLFVTALEISPERHLRIQAAFQRHVDNSVSKTINLPHSATPADVARIYQRAFELGLKGITVFRHQSKPSQVLELGVGEEPFEHEHGAKCDPGECKL